MRLVTEIRRCLHLSGVYFSYLITAFHLISYNTYDANGLILISDNVVNSTQA